MHAHLRIRHSRCLFQNAFHPLIRREKLALDDAETRQFAVEGTIGLVGRFGIDDFLQYLPELQVRLPWDRREVALREFDP
jgi:hypothetical protein